MDSIRKILKTTWSVELQFNYHFKIMSTFFCPSISHSHTIRVIKILNLIYIHLSETSSLSI